MDPKQVERFWAKVNKTEGCWNWTAATKGEGYGNCSTGKGTQGYAHRYSYELANGAIPAGMFVDHICHNRLCVNPDHLRAVTPKQNMENRGGLHKGSKSGIRGVSWHKESRKWAAYVRHSSKTYYLGLFQSKEDAGEAAKAKRLELFTHNNNDRKEAA